MEGSRLGNDYFLAALAGVNPALYEAAVMDGAGRFRQIWHITRRHPRHDHYHADHTSR